MPSTIDSTIRLKTNKDIEIMTTIINQLSLIKMFIEHVTTVDHKFVSSIYSSLTKIDNIWGHKTTLINLTFLKSFKVCYLSPRNKN